MATYGKIGQKGHVTEKPFERRLPYVVMGVDKTRRNNLVCAVNHLTGSRWRDGRFDTGNAIPINQDICLGGDDAIVVVVAEHRA